MCEFTTTHLPCVPESARAARDWVAGELARMYESFDAALDDVTVVVSELVTNCVRADTHHFALGIDGHHRRVTVATIDDAPGTPTRRDAKPEDVAGRGLAIVEALADRWGVMTEEHTKTVWADLPVPPGAGPRFECNN